MTNIERVLLVLRERGPSSQLEVRADLPKLTARQIQKALQNAALTGRCHFEEGETKTGTSGRQGLWFLGETPPEPEPTELEAPRGKFGIGRVNSVWQLGEQA